MSDHERGTGCRTADTSDPVQGARVPLRLLYPTRAAGTTERFGPYALEVAVDAPVDGDALPLVVVSHGNGGSPWVYRDLAAHLAQAGFVVALIEHPGNNRHDSSLEHTVANLENRPRHVRLAVDAAFADALVGPHLRRGGVGVVGHSIGAYTALAVAGGRPSAFAHETADGQSRAVDVERDARVAALVLLAPAAGWFVADGALADVDLPILLYAGDRDDITPPLHAEIITSGVKDPRRVDARVVAGGGHFAFLTPFPPEMRRADFPPAHDPPGFDRAAFLPTMNAEVTAFLKRELGPRE